MAAGIVITLGLLSFLFALWILAGLYRRFRGIIPDRPLPSSLWLGVCADVSLYLEIPVVVIRCFVLLYTPLLFGILFYFVYYWVMQSKKPPATLEEVIEKPMEVTQIESHYY